MQARLKLSHDEMTVLAAIADQELLLSEILEGVFGKLYVIEQSKIQMQSLLLVMVKSGLLLKRTTLEFLFPRTLYAIAPNILALNNPPYSYESWRGLSD